MRLRRKSLPPSILNAKWWKDMSRWEKFIYRNFPRVWMNREIKLASLNPVRFFNRYVKVLNPKNKEDK